MILGKYVSSLKYWSFCKHLDALEYMLLPTSAVWFAYLKKSMATTGLQWLHNDYL